MNYTCTYKSEEKLIFSEPPPRYLTITNDTVNDERKIKIKIRKYLNTVDISNYSFLAIRWKVCSNFAS